MAPEPTDVDSQNFEELNQVESTLALIKPDCLTPHRIQAIKDLVQLAGFELVRQKKFWFTRESASEFYLEHKDKPFFEDLISYITCAPVMAFELRQNDAVQIWRRLLGPTDPEVARDTDINSIRAMFGVDITKNAVHGSDSVEAAQREIEFVFSNSIHTMVSDSKENGDDTLFKSEYTLAIIKPDAVSSGYSDTILKAINYKGFEVLNFEKLHMSEEQAKEFYQDQKSKPFYQELVSFMASGEVHIILLKGINAIRGWREMMGPADVEVARITRPQSIRALYGSDEVKNAIHGSESKEAANREINFFFPNFFESLSTGTDNAQTHDEVDEIETSVIADTNSVAEERDQQEERSETFELEQAPEENLELPQEEFEVKKEEQHDDPSNTVIKEENGDAEVHQPVIEDQDEQITQAESCNVIPDDFHEVSVSESESKSEREDDDVKESTPYMLEAEYPTELAVDTPGSPEVNSLDSVTQSESGLNGASKIPNISEVQDETDISKQSEAITSNTNEVVLENVNVDEPEIPDSSVNAEIDGNEQSVQEEAEIHEPEGEKSLIEEIEQPEKAIEETSNDTTDVSSLSEHNAPQDVSVDQETLDKNENPEASHLEQTFVLIKPDVYGTNRKEDILQLIEDKKFRIVRSEEVTFSKSLAQEFYHEYKGKHFFENVVTLMSSSPCLALILEKGNAVQEWRSLMGPANSLKAKFESPGSIRALYGTDSIKNAVHGSDSIARAQTEIELVFGRASSGVQPEENEAVPKQDEAQSQFDHDAVAEELVNTHSEIDAQPSDQTDPQPMSEVIVSDTVMSQLENDPTPNQVESQPQETTSTEIQDTPEDKITPEANPELPEPIVAESIGGIQEDEAVVPELTENINEVSRKPSDAFPKEIHSETKKVESLESSETGDALSQEGIAEQPNQENTTEDQIRLEETLALIKPDAYSAGYKAAILDMIKSENFSIIKEKEISLTKGQAEEFYKEHAGKPFYDSLVNWMSNQTIYALVLEKNNAIQAWRELIGPTDSLKAKEQHPKSIRALYGTDGSHNAVHGSDSTESAAREIKIIFSPTSSPASSNVSQSDVEQTLALIKPDAYGAGRKVSIQKILKKEGFTIVKEKEVRLTRLKAKEFYAEHDGKPFFEKLITWMSSAPIYAMILRKEGAIKAWRELMGPTNSIKAKEISPKSIRALYGTDGSKNAVHGSDSFTSATREIKLIFGNSDASNGAKKSSRSPVIRSIPSNGNRVAATQAKSRPLYASDTSNVKRSVRPSTASTTVSATAPKRSSIPPNRRSPTSGEVSKTATSKEGSKTRAPSTLRTATKLVAGTMASRASAPRPASNTRASSIPTSRKLVDSKITPAQPVASRPATTRPRPSSAASKERSSIVDRLTRPTAASATKSNGEHEVLKTRVSKSPNTVKDKVPTRREPTVGAREIIKNGSKESISTRTSSRTSTTSNKVGTIPRKAPISSMKPGTLKSGAKSTGQLKNVKLTGVRSSRDSHSSKSITPTESVSEPTSVVPSAEHSDADIKDDGQGVVHSTKIDDHEPTVAKEMNIELPDAGIADHAKQPEKELCQSSNDKSTGQPSISAQ